MKQRVSIASASPFLALVLRKTLARSPHLELSDPRDVSTMLMLLRDRSSLAIVDAELLSSEPDGAAFRKELLTRRAPALIVDARARGIPSEIASVPAIVILRGRQGGELDVDAIESGLLAAVGSALRHRSGPSSETLSAPSQPQDRAEPYDDVLELIVLGVSTGGPTLLLELLADLKEPAIPMLIVQHMPASETPGFAARLSEGCGLTVREIADGPLAPVGTIGLVRGGSDFRIVRRTGLHLRSATLEGNPFHPNIDEVLTSAVNAGIALGAAILTGMGQDGAAGALAMAKKGLPVIAQRPDTCAVAGMPQAVIDKGAARWVQSPEAIASTLNRWSDAARGNAKIGGTTCLP